MDTVADGFAAASTATLLAVRRNLLAGLDAVAVALRAGRFDTVGANGKAPPSQSGQLTLALLRRVDAELRQRNVSTVR